MRILAVDTSAKVSSVSVVEDNSVLAEFNINMGLTHSQTLMPMVDDCLKEAKISLDTIDAFAVSAGPGSFTGIRIGIGAVKGLAYGLNKPCVALSTLEGLANNVACFSGIICPVMDARCSQVYTAFFEAENQSLTRLSEDRAISIDELYDLLTSFKKNIIFVGDGADLCYNKLKDKLPNLYLAPPSVKFQRASSVGLSAIKKAQSGETVSAAEIMPCYLRLPQGWKESV